MTTFTVPINHYGKTYRFHRLLGLLTFKEATNEHPTQKTSIGNQSKQRCLNVVNNPFLAPRNKTQKQTHHIKHEKIAHLWARLLTWLCFHCYPLAYGCVHIRLSLFDNATEACKFYYKLFPDFKKQKVLCLPRAFFVATTSRRFSKHGVAFIGAFLPTVRMHAWIVEDGKPADPYDNEWIEYQPVMMIL